MHPKIRSFFSRKNTLLRTTNQAITFNKNEILISGIGFSYRATNDNLDISPPVSVPLDKFISVTSILGEIDQIKTLPKGILFKSRTGEWKLPVLGVDYTPNIMFEGESVDVDDDFLKVFQRIKAIFQPTSIYIINPKTAIVTDQFNSILCKVSTTFDTKICGMNGAISDYIPIIDGASYSWSLSENNWHLLLSQKIENEEFSIVFSSLTAMEIENFTQLINLAEGKGVDWVSNIRITPEFKKAIFFANRITDHSHLTQEGSDVILKYADGESRFYDLVTGDVPDGLLIASLIPFLKADFKFFKPYLFFGKSDERNFVMIVSEDEKVTVLRAI